MDRVAIAFSAGVDSTFLAKVAHDTLGDNMVAYTVQAGMVPEREIAFHYSLFMSVALMLVSCGELIEVDEMQVEGFAENSRERCYFCKRNLFSKIAERAKAAGFSTVCEGSNADDIHDYRPGMRALQELGIRSPLQECGLTKADIRELSRQLDLPTWDKPSFACKIQRFKTEHCTYTAYTGIYGNLFAFKRNSDIALMSYFIENCSDTASCRISYNVHFRAYREHCFNSVPKRSAVTLNVSFNAVFVTRQKYACSVPSDVSRYDYLVTRLCICA